jgi:hypothetical protein
MVQTGLQPGQLTLWTNSLREAKREFERIQVSGGVLWFCIGDGLRLSVVDRKLGRSQLQTLRFPNKVLALAVDENRLWPAPRNLIQSL